jgi:hypothetical protein
MWHLNATRFHVDNRHPRNSTKLLIFLYYRQQHTSVKGTHLAKLLFRPKLPLRSSFHQTLHQLLISSERCNIETATRYAQIASTGLVNRIKCHLTLQLLIGLAGKEKPPSSYLPAATAQSCWMSLPNARSQHSLSRHSSGPSRERQSRNGLSCLSS